MLVLTRRVDQAVLIGGEIEVRLLGIEGNRVRLGFTAPKGMSIVRDNAKQQGDKDDHTPETV